MDDVLSLPDYEIAFSVVFKLTILYRNTVAQELEVQLQKNSISLETFGQSTWGVTQRDVDRRRSNFSNHSARRALVGPGSVMRTWKRRHTANGSQ